MKIFRIFLIIAFMIFCKSSQAQLQIRDSHVSEDYNNWIKDSPRETWKFLYNKYINTYKDSMFLDKSYSFYALIKLKDSMIVMDSIRFIEFPGYDVPDKLKNRVKEVIQWTNGKWAGPSQKVLFQFCYNRPGAPVEETDKSGFLPYKYCLAKPDKTNEYFIWNTNFICIFCMY